MHASGRDSGLCGSFMREIDISSIYICRRNFLPKFIELFTEETMLGPSEGNQRVIMGFALKARINTCIQEFSFLAAILV